LLPSVHSRPYGLCFAYRTVLLRNFIHPVRVSFVHNYHSPLEFNTVRYFFKTLIQPVRVSFVHNYHSPLEFNTVRYFFKTLIQPVRVSFVHNYHSPLEFNTVRYFFKTLIQPVRVSFVHNYRTVLLNLPDGTTLHFHLQGDRTGFVLHTVRYFCETSFSPYGFHLYTNISSIPQSFGIQYRTVLLQNLDSARTGFICTQLPYGTTLHFHVQGEGVSLPLARSHAFSLGHRCSHVLPQSHHFQTVSTMSTLCMSTFECPKVIPYGLDLSLVPCRFLLHRTGFLSVIPYGLSVRTCGSHLAIPYGATPSTVRDNFSFFSLLIPYGW